MTQKAPERIWAGKHHSTWWQSRPHHQMTEYLRIDHALALVAAERGACEQACVGEYLEEEPQTEDDAAYDRGVADCIAAIRARSDADTQAALERRDARIRNKALREAAEAVYRSDLKHDAYDAILALITEDQSDD